MARPRDAVWESADKAVYIKATKGVFLVVDTRGTRKERQRASLDDALALAKQMTGLPAPGSELTFFGLAVEYFKHGLTLWDDGSGVTIEESTLEDRKGVVRNHYGFIGNTALSDLPNDFLRQAVQRLRDRGHHNSKSLQDKVLWIGCAVLKYGKEVGAIPHDRHFPGPIQKVKKAKIDRKDFVGQIRRQLPTHRELHRFARRSAECLDAPYMRLFWWLAAYIGFRSGELLALTIDDVCVERRVRISVVKKVVRKSGRGLVVQQYAKGLEHRTVTVPRILEGPLLARVDEVRTAGRTLLFPMWGAGPERHICYSTLQDHFVRVGAEIGWTVRTRSEERKITGGDGRTRTYKAKPGSLEYTIHDLRAFAATTMYDSAAGGFRLRGMNMSIKAVAAQLGDNEEVVKETYLGVFEGNAFVLDREVP